MLEILLIYNEKFFNINLYLFEGNLKELDFVLYNGDVDLIVGMLLFNVENVEIVFFCNEEVFMIVFDNILVKYFFDDYNEIKLKLEKGVDIILLKDCLFLMVNVRNRVRIIVDEMFNEK